MDKTELKVQKFLKTLSERLNTNGDPVLKIKKKHLKKILRKRVAALKEGSKLKQELDKNFVRHCDTLLKLLKSGKEPDEHAVEQSDKSVLNSSNGAPREYYYNLYCKKTEEINGETADEDPKNTLIYQSYTKQVWLHKSEEELFNLLDRCRDDNQEAFLMFPWLSHLGSLCTYLCGEDQPSNLQHIMAIFVRQYASALTDLVKPVIRIKGLKELRHQGQRYLEFFHFKYLRLSSRLFPSKPPYEDLLAGILATHVDICLVLRQNGVEDECLSGKYLCRLLLRLLRSQRHYGCDVLLQLDYVTSEAHALLRPFVNSVLMSEHYNVGVPSIYTKYILTGRQICQWWPDNSSDIKQKVLSVAAPNDFLEWLKEKNSDILDEFPENRKFRGTHITRFILEEVDQDTVEELLDLLTATLADETEANSVEPDSTIDIPTPENADDLFVIDKLPDSKTAQDWKDIHSEDEEEAEQSDDGDTAPRDIVFEIYTAKEAAEKELDNILGEIDQDNDKDYLPPTVVVIDKDAGENPDDESLVASRLRDEDGCVLIDGDDIEVAEEYHGADMESNITDGDVLESTKSDSSEALESTKSDSSASGYLSGDNEEDNDDPMERENDDEVDSIDHGNDKEVDSMECEHDEKVDSMDHENDKEVDSMGSENDEKEDDPMGTENDEKEDDPMESEDDEVDNNKTNLTGNKDNSDNKENLKQDDAKDANNPVGDGDASETVTPEFGTGAVDSEDDYYEGVSPNEDKENINGIFFVDRGENRQNIKDGVAAITGSREIDSHDDDEQEVNDNKGKSDNSLGFQQMQNEIKEKSTRMSNKKQQEITPRAKIDPDNTTPPKSKRRKVDMIIDTKKPAKKPAPFFTPHIRGERRNSSEKLKTPSPKHSDQSETSDAEVRSPQNNKELLSSSTRKQTSPVKQKLSVSSPIKNMCTTRSPTKHSKLDQHEKVRDSPPSPRKRKVTVEATQSSLSRFIQNQMETSAGTDTSSAADSAIIPLMSDKKTRRRSKLGSDRESVSRPTFESPKGITFLDEDSQTSKNFVKVIASPEYFSTKPKSPSKKSRRVSMELKSSEKKNNNKRLSINRKHSPTQNPMDNSVANNQEGDGGLQNNYADTTAIKPDQNLPVISPQASTPSLKTSPSDYIITRNVRPIPMNKTASATTGTKSSTSELESSKILSQTDSNSSEAHVEDSVKQDSQKQKSCEAHVEDREKQKSSNASPLKPKSQRISSMIRENNSRSRRRKTLSGAELALPTVQEHEEVISLDSNTQNDTSPFKEPPRKTYSQRRRSMPSRMLDYSCESPSKRSYGASKRTRSVAKATESNDDEIEFSVENLTDTEREDFLYVLASDSDRSEDSVAVRRSRRRTTSTSSVASDISIVSTSSVTLRARAGKQNSPAPAKSIKSSAQKKALRRSLPVPAAPTPGDTPNRRRSARLQPPMEK